MADKVVLTKYYVLMLALTIITAAIGIGGCVMTVPGGEYHGSEGITTSRGEHERGDGAGNGERSVQRSNSKAIAPSHAGASDGEESGNTLALTERYDTVRKGARLILVYDADSNAFTGTVENTTDSTLHQVRVEVHLSNGVELGPTEPVDLAPGQIVEVSLPATDQAFDGWTPHAEVGPGSGGEAGEHGPGGENGAGEPSSGR